ncbi:MAG: NADP-dependent oxidoreductase [Blastomonas fulva]|uniref:NADP-dependent oxidoreductase n=1 Tax=Blastomonas fulva TaxID=1550728 RepID=UPI004033F5E5
MNRQCILVSRPEGIAQAENFALVDAEPQPLAEGDIRVSNRFLSVEPAMRGWIADKGNYAAPVEIGAVMRALAAGIVIESRDPDYPVGQAVTGWFGWQQEAVVRADAIVRRIGETDLPLSLSLGVLGINGVTAHLALTGIGEPQAGDTVLVSTAAGSVGSAVGQIAKILGCKTIGITGGPQKVAQCTGRFGYDAAIDYKAADFDAQLAAVCAGGINVYFDNTAGAISDRVYPHLALGARVIVCGTAAIERWDPWPHGPRVERHLLVKRARMQGFVIFDHMDRYEASVAVLADWVRSGQLVYDEDVLDGMDAAPDALAGLYRGENSGKRVIAL